MRALRHTRAERDREKDLVMGKCPRGVCQEFESDGSR
jgi:hypothetical protein